MGEGEQLRRQLDGFLVVREFLFRVERFYAGEELSQIQKSIAQVNQEIKKLREKLRD